MNIYDIAQEANVSISSVSRYINHPEKLSQKKWQAIDAVVKRHCFVPSRVARDLVTRPAKCIGIMMNDMKYERFATISSNLEQAFFNMGFSTIFCNTGNSQEKTQQYLLMLASKRVEALVLIGSQLARPDIVDMLSSHFHDIPIVTADMDVNLPNCYCVNVDHAYGIELAVNHLVSRGHEHLAFVACTNSENTKRKASFFRNAIAVRKLPMHEDGNLVQIPLSVCDSSDLDIAELLRQKSPDYSGIIFSHDILAARAVSSLQFHGYSVPRDYAVIGYDNLSCGLYCQPTLTTIDTQLSFTARIIANMINDLFNKRVVSNKVIINPTLVTRFST